MYELDNSFQPDSTITRKIPKYEVKPAKVRKYHTLLLNGFGGMTDAKTINTIIKGLYPDYQGKERVTIYAGCGEGELPIEDTIRIFNGCSVTLVIRTAPVEGCDAPMQLLQLCKDLTNYLLRDPHNLDIPLIIFDFASTPDSCKFMCDSMVSHYTASLFPIKPTQVEISRRKDAPSGGLIELNNLDSI